MSSPIASDEDLRVFRSVIFHTRAKLLNKRNLYRSDSSSKVTKLVGLCRTRWVERFEAFDNYAHLLEAIATTCDLIVYPHLYIHDADLNELVQES